MMELFDEYTTWGGILCGLTVLWLAMVILQQHLKIKDLEREIKWGKRR